MRATTFFLGVLVHGAVLPVDETTRLFESLEFWSVSPSPPVQMPQGTVLTLSDGNDPPYCRYTLSFRHTGDTCRFVTVYENEIETQRINSRSLGLLRISYYTSLQRKRSLYIPNECDLRLQQSTRSVRLSPEQQEELFQAGRNGETPKMAWSGRIIWSGERTHVETVDAADQAFQNTDFSTMLGDSTNGPNAIIGSFFQDLTFGHFPVAPIVAEDALPMISFKAISDESTVGFGRSPRTMLESHQYYTLHTVDKGPTSEWRDWVQMKLQVTPASAKLQLFTSEPHRSIVKKEGGGVSIKLESNMAILQIRKSSLNGYEAGTRWLLYVPRNVEVRIREVTRLILPESFSSIQLVEKRKDGFISALGPVPENWQKPDVFLTFEDEINLRFESKEHNQVTYASTDGLPRIHANTYLTLQQNKKRCFESGYEAIELIFQRIGQQDTRNFRFFLRKSTQKGLVPIRNTELEETTIRVDRSETIVRINRKAVTKKLGKDGTFLVHIPFDVQLTQIRRSFEAKASLESENFTPLSLFEKIPSEWRPRSRLLCFN